MKKILITLFSLLIGAGLHAQTLEWVKALKGSKTLRGYAITVDSSGNIYTAGSFQGTVDFDPGPGVSNLTSYASTFDIFVQVLDSSGNFLWAKAFGNSSQDYAHSIAVDSSGNVYTMGDYLGTVDFDPGAGTSNHTSLGSTDVFIQKLDPSGNFLWAKTFGGSGAEHGGSIALDPSGNVYTIGTFRNRVDFDPGAGISFYYSAGNNDAFIQKLDPSGNFLWTKTFGGTRIDYGYSIALDALGNIYTAGSFQDTVDFDPGAGTTILSSAGGHDGYIQKFDSLGNFRWAKTFGGTSVDFVASIAVSASGNVYATGSFHDTADFDPGAGTSNLASEGNYDIFVQALDSLGNFLWAKGMGGPVSDQGISITVDDLENVYTIGRFEDTIDFNPGASTYYLASAGNRDVFVQKLAPSGSFLWARAFRGPQDVNGAAITVDASGDIYTTGYFQGTVDFDPGVATSYLTSTGGFDAFVHKMSHCPITTSTDIQTACNSYTWMDGVTYTTSNNTATYTLTNAAGCDSVITLDLTINNSNTTDIQTACNSYTWIDGNTYTASNNTATYTLTNAAGCDSVVTLNLTINSVSDITTSVSGITISANNTNATYTWLDCDNNHAIINGETNVSFTPTLNGNYAVEITENGCIDTSACVAITTVGIVENSFGDAFTVYPNPTSGDFSIDLGDAYEDVQIVITDVSGRVIQSHKITRTKTLNLLIEDPAGIYMVSIQAGNKMASIRLLKE